MCLWIWPVFEIGPRKACLRDEGTEHSSGACHTEIKFRTKPCLRNQRSTHQNKHQLLKHGLNLGMWSGRSWKNTGWFRLKPTWWWSSALIFTGCMSLGKLVNSFHYQVSQLPNEVTATHLTGLCVHYMKYWRAVSKSELLSRLSWKKLYHRDKRLRYTYVCNTGQKSDISVLCVG